MIKKVIRDKSRCAKCMAEKFFLKNKNIVKKVVRIVLIPNYLSTKHYKTVEILLELQKRYRECNSKDKIW